MHAVVCGALSGAPGKRRNFIRARALRDMRDIIAGVILIGIGLAMGGSVFTGDFSITSLFFDGLGLLWIGKGVHGLLSARGE